MVIGGPVWLYLLIRLTEVVLLIIMTCYWLRGMQRAMEACHPVSRSTEPGMVWLTLIPVFGFVWQFIASKNTAEALAREYHRRGWHSDEDRPGLELGAVTGVVVCGVVLVRVIFIQDIHPGFGFIGSLAIGFCMFRHVERLNAYRERLEREADPTTAFGQIPTPFFQQPAPNFQQPFPPNPFQQQYPPQPFYPQQQQYPPFDSYRNPQQPPPGYAPVPQYQQFPPPPQQPVAPPPQKEQQPSAPDYQRWMPKQNNEQQQPPAPAQDDLSRWQPKNDPPRP